MAQSPLIRTLPMAQWISLAREGVAPPVTIPLEGDSMRPLIRRGKDPVTIIPLNRPPKKGDVVLFVLGDRYIVHRLWKIKGDSVRTLGDNCWNPEPWFPRAQVLGLAAKYSRGGKARRLDTPWARAWGRGWMAVYPIRLCYKRLKALAGRCYRKIFPKPERR